MSAITFPSKPSVNAASTANSEIVRMRDLVFTWPGSQGFSLRIGDFVLRRGERMLLIGPSGSGKSTFLSLLCGIITASSGHLAILGADMARLSPMRRDRFRAEHFGIIFQMFNLLPYGSIIDNVLLPLSFAPERRRRASRAGKPEAEAARLLSSLGLDSAELADLSVATLSVGQQQRVAAARALIGSPELIVADEPTSALDKNRRGGFIELVLSEAEAAGSTLIMVSHDEELAKHFSRVVRLDEIAETERAARKGGAP